VSIFVGRSQELRESLSLLEGAQDGEVRDVVGVQGIGKSSYLSELAGAARASLDQVLTVPTIDMGRYGLGEGFVDDFGPTASTAVLWETFTSSRALMLLLAGSHPEFEPFRQECRTQGQQTKVLAQTSFSTSNSSHIERVEFSSVVHLDNDEVKRQIREAQRKLDDVFVECWKAFAQGRHRVLITVDTFELIANDEMGHWMTRMALRLPQTLTVFARTPSDYELGAKSPRFQRMQLDSFTELEVADLLARRFHPVLVPSQVAELVFEKIGGHPGGVTLVVDLIAESGGPARPLAELRRSLERLSPDPEARWAELVDRTLNAIKRPLLRQAVDASACASTFDEPLLRKLLGASGAGPAIDDASELIAQMSGLGLLELVPPPSEDQSMRFRLHEFIRRPVAAQLRSRRPQYWHDLNQSAADYYFEQLHEWDDENNTSFSEGFRFENLEWQERKRAWLRHSGALADQRVLTRTRFVLVFLEAFWWWGSYHPFPFNRRLLEDWTRALDSWQASGSVPADSVRHKTPELQLAEALTYVLDNYPTGWLKSADAPWDEIRKQLLLVRRLCGLQQQRASGSAAKQLRSEEQLADAFITVFLADTRMYRDPHDPRADQYFTTALATFEELNDGWNVAWITCGRADLALRQGDLAAAHALVSRSAARIRDFVTETGDHWDHELIANLSRIQADACWAADDLGLAGRAYGRAVAHAYWLNGEPNPPEDYTQQIYTEMTTRAAERVLSLAGAPEQRAVFLASMRRTLPPGSPDASELTAGDGLDELREQLFPPGPTSDELRLEDSEFMGDWNVAHEDREDPSATIAELCSTPEENLYE
jgi:hypothetical protein